MTLAQWLEPRDGEAVASRPAPSLLAGDRALLGGRWVEVLDVSLGGSRVARSADWWWVEYVDRPGGDAPVLVARVPASELVLVVAS